MSHQTLPARRTGFVLVSLILTAFVVRLVLIDQPFIDPWSWRQGDVAAIWATFFYAFAPLSIAASRAFMPDMPSLSLAIMGSYFFLRWIEEDRFRWLIFSAALVSLSLLVKLPMAIIGVPLLYLAA